MLEQQFRLRSLLLGIWIIMQVAITSALVEAEPPEVVKLSWYMQDTLFNGANSSAIPVTAFNASDIPNLLGSFLRGQIFVFDDPLTQEPSLTSPIFGRAQGTYSYVSPNAFIAYLSYTVRIQSGKYNGSSLNVIGTSPDADLIKTTTISGGTGYFALARGIVSSEVVKIFGQFNSSATVLTNATIYLDHYF